MKKRILSILLTLSMVLTIAPAAFAAETPDGNAITDADTLIAAIQAADDGATVEIPAGNFSIGNLTIAKAVSLSGEGADETTLTGSIMYEANSAAAEDGAAITVRGITLEPSGNQNHQGLCWNNHGTLSGHDLNVEGCIFNGWEYAIGVNSGAAGNTLNVSDTVFTNTFCAMAVKIGNTVFTKDVDTTGSDYAIQAFGKSSDNADYFNGYYESVGDYTDDLKDETLDNPTVGGYTSGEGKVIVATPADFERNLASANDGDTIQLTTGTYKLSNELLTIERRVNLKGAGEDKTTMIGTVKYKLAAVDETADAALSVSGINFAAGDNALQGLVFTGTAANTEQHVDITVSDCSFDGWTYGLAMHSHANCCILNVENSTFDTWCGINFNNDASNEAHPANNTLNIGEGNDFNCSYAVEQYDNGNTATGSADVDYYKTAEDYKAGTPVEVTRVLNATQLQDAVNSATDATTIELAGNITLASSITVPTGADITIKGNGYTISYDGSAPVSKTAFTGSGEGVEQEGIPEDVSLTVSDTTFQNTSQTPAGYAVLLDFNADGTKIAMDGCTFENLYCGVYVNPVMDGTITPPVISITNSTYNNTTYGYSVDEVTNGAVVGGVKTTFDGNKGIMTEAEAWEDAVAATVISNGVEKAYQSWAAAYAAAGEDDAIKLQQNITGPITIGKAVTIDGNGKTITAESGDAITVTAAGVVLNNVNAETTAENNLGHALVVGSDQTKVDGAITVSGGSYAAGNGDMQGQGAIRIFAAGEVKVENTATTGGIHVFDAGSYTITGNTVGFTYEGDTPYVGILVFYTEKQTGLDGEAVASGLLDGNTVAVPNTSSIYAQVVNGGWEDGSTDGVAADDSVARIDNNYYKTLQDAVDVVDNEGTITVVADCNETVTVSRVVTFTIETENGAGFTGTISAGSGYRVTNENGVYTVVEYKPSPSGGGGSSTPSYTVSTPAKVDNGTVTVSPRNASRGATVTITVKPDAGYELDELAVTDKNGDTIQLTNRGDGKYTFTMPASAVEIEVSFARITAPSFSDVDADDYFAEAVEWAVANGITNGTSAANFSPDASCTRAQMVTFLWRSAGSPAPKTSSNPFADVKAGAYYYDAVLWAVENGVTHGTSAAAFSPDATVTRGQTVTFLYRAAGSPEALNGTAFTDVAADAYYASAVAWAVQQAITTGTSASTFSPDADCTRAQIVTFLFRSKAE